MAGEKYIWEVRFFIPITLDPSSKLEWKRNNVMIKSRSNYALDGTIFIENDFSNEKFAEAKEFIQGFVDSYFILTNQYLRIFDICAVVENRRVMHKSNDLSGSFTIPVVITENLVDKSIDFFEKIESIKNDERYRIKRILRWFRRGLDDLDKTDKFISYWISFNALYGYYKNDGEEQAFLDALEENIDEKIAENILDEEKNNVDALIRGNVVKRNRKGQISKKLSEVLEKKRKDNEPKKALKYAMCCIYQVRCNVFHGDKEYIDLIKYCIPILRYVIRECLKSFIWKI